MSRYDEGKVGKAMKVMKNAPRLEAEAEALCLHIDLLDIGEESMRGMTTELCHTLALFTDAKAAKIVTMVKEVEGFEAWRMLEHRCEQASSTTTVQKAHRGLELQLQR